MNKWILIGFLLVLSGCGKSEPPAVESPVKFPETTITLWSGNYRAEEWKVLDYSVKDNGCVTFTTTNIKFWIACGTYTVQSDEWPLPEEIVQ